MYRKGFMNRVILLHLALERMEEQIQYRLYERSCCIRKHCLKRLNPELRVFSWQTELLHVKPWTPTECHPHATSGVKLFSKFQRIIIVAGTNNRSSTAPVNQTHGRTNTLTNFFLYFYNASLGTINCRREWTHGTWSECSWTNGRWRFCVYWDFPHPRPHPSRM